MCVVAGLRSTGHQPSAISSPRPFGPILAVKKQHFPHGIHGLSAGDTAGAISTTCTSCFSRAISPSQIQRLHEAKPDGGRTYTGFNFFSYDDRDLLLALVRGEHLPAARNFTGVFAVLIDRAPAPVWEVLPRSERGGMHIRRKKPQPWVNHYYFPHRGRRVGARDDQDLRADAV
jgi:hypothetical protein